MRSVIPYADTRYPVPAGLLQSLLESGAGRRHYGLRGADLGHALKQLKSEYAKQQEGWYHAGRLRKDFDIEDTIYA